MITISKNVRRIGYILASLLWVSSFIYIVNLNLVLNENFAENSNLHQDRDPNDDFDIELGQSSLSEYSGVGKAQNVTKFAQASFINDNLNISNDENASIIVPNKWHVNEINWSLNQIYEYNNTWTNETFNNPIDTALWSNFTRGSHRDYSESGWYQNPFGINDSITLTIKQHSTDDWDGVKSYLNYSRYLNRENIPYGFWYLDFQYKFIDYSDWLDQSFQSRFIGTIVMGGTEIEFMNPKLSDIVDNKWERGELSFFPEFYGFNPPADLTVNFTIDFRDPINQNKNLTLFIDNFTLTLQTIPKPSQISLNITDYEHSISTPISDIDYGSGEVSLSNSWKGDIDGKEYKFGFESNSTSDLIVFTESEVTAISQSYTRRQLTSLIGSEYNINNETVYNWTMYVPINIPGAYTDNFYFNISKPINWNVTQVIDPYSNDRINDTIGAGYGNSTLTIPNEIVTNGIWKIIAEAPNYIKEANIFRQSNSGWQKNATFHHLDTLKINGTINKTFLIPNIDNTNATLKIYYPNETICYQEVDVSVDPDGNYEFSEITLTGKSAVSGEYSAQIVWHNFNVNMTQVGFSFLNFQVIHKTNLTAVDNYFELYAGDPLLLKVKYIDSDFNESIQFGSITYNSTYDESGIMTYQGSGIYLADLDTSSLGLGNYYFSCNATKEYYEDNYMEDIIHLRIVAQPLELEVPHEILTAMANSYFTCDINVTGAFTGALIWPVNISTDWLNPYSVVDYGDGTFTLNFSTYNLPTQGISEIYTLTIFAEKINYRVTSQALTLTVNPIQTIVNVNSSIIYIPIEEIAELELSFNQEGSGVLINGATCNVTWLGRSSVTSHPQGFTVSFNTSTLSIDTYTAILKLEKIGYETAYKSITIVVEQKNIEVNTIGFQDSIQALTGERIGIKFNLTELDSSICIENATVYYSWDYGTGFFDYLGNGTYELNLKLPNNVKENHKMTLTISKEGSLYKTRDFSFIIVISEQQLPNYLFWILVAGVLVLFSVLSIIGIRSYVILPKKRAKESKLLARAQKYKDIMNIEAVVVSERQSGLYLFLKSYYALEKYRKELLSGFIHAITTISKEIVRKEELPNGYSEERQPRSIESLIELDFKHFYFLIGDYKDLRVIFILREKASDRFKNQLQNLLLALDLKFSEELINWTGNIANFEKLMPSTINEYFELYYKDFFQLNKPKYIAKVKEEIELSTMENRLLNVIYSLSKGKKKFYLHDAVEMVEEKNKDLVIGALESLIEKKIIEPSL